jgi:hypothetical protein
LPGPPLNALVRLPVVGVPAALAGNVVGREIAAGDRVFIPPPTPGLVVGVL